MPREWYTTCKDCGKEFGYSDDSYQISALRGLSRPERCPECRKLHTREIAILGLSHFELTPVLPIPQTGLKAGRLGGLIRPPRIHEARDREPSFDFDKFGIKDSHIREYFELMLKKQVTIVVAPTGAGKSTFLPYRLMVPPSPFQKDLFTRNGQIVITQPRIQATRNIPLFVARDLHGSNLGAGFDIGFRHSGSPSTDWRNKMVYMTDGTLINMIVRNELDRLSVIMIDEAHERSVNIDLILGLLRTQLPRYPKLKLIIASATINAGLFLEYYGGPNDFDPDKYAHKTDEGFLAYDNQQIANILQNTSVGFYGFPGKRQYPVETRFREDNEIPEEQFAGRMPDEMANKVLEILRDMKSGKEETTGDILAFLHGELPIERTVELIRSGVEEDTALAGNVDVLPLYTKLPQKKQDAALLPKKDKNRLRVVVTTNVAETSLTVDGIVHVVDSGLINESQWDPKTQTSFVVPKIHSQAGCKQRWGRGGRIQPGIAHCLYSKDQFENFPKHTEPEILRAPLDQIVLTAKTAGIDNIKDFHWIQRPSEDELDRAPRFLEQIGAVDAQGDITEHGLELRNFGEEVDIANLMILADRFGCAVEMATILPMLKLGGYTKLLLWDKGWDAHTKRSVHKIHQSLLGPCMDDLEFSLKMWHAWEGTHHEIKSYTNRKEWSNRYFVNNQIFEDQIVPEREGLLASLSAHKKTQDYRKINFDLLTRLRMLMIYGLPNQIYILDKQQSSEAELTQLPLYHPFIPKSANSPELELLHADAVVEISPESICSNRALQAFVCGQRQRIRRRMSPLSEPLTIITASFLTLINIKWLDIIDQPLMNLVKIIAAESRNEVGKLIETTTFDRLFIDQTYPIGATFNCRKDKINESVVQIGQQILAAPKIQPRKSNEEIDVPIDLEYLEAERAIRSTGISDEDEKYIIDVGDDPDIDTEFFELEEGLLDEIDDIHLSKSHELNQREECSLYTGRIVHFPNQVVESEFNAFVIGHDFSDNGIPVVLLEIPDSPTPFERFSTEYKIGDSISAEITSIEQYVNDRLTYLVVREDKTGLEIIMDPYDASLSGRNFAIEILKPGQKIDATIEDIDYKACRVKVSRLKKAEEDLLEFIGREDEKLLDAVIVEVRENGLYVWINPDEPIDIIPISSFVNINRLPQRPEEMWLGYSCKVKVRPQKFEREMRRGVGSLSNSDFQKIKAFNWNKKLQFNEETSMISVSKRITYDQRNQLLKLSKKPEFQKTINILYRRSNEIQTRILDISGLEKLVDYEGQRLSETWKVTKVLPESVFVVSPDGFETIIPKREVVYNPNVNLQEVIDEGSEVDITVKQIDIQEGRADLSLLKPEEDPINKYQVGQVVTGIISNIIQHGSFIGAIVELEPGVLGRVHISECAWWYVEDVNSVLKINQTVKVKIIDIDRVDRRLSLTMRLEENDPLNKITVNQIAQGEVKGFTKDGSGVFIQLSPGVEGFVYKDEISFTPVQDARKFLNDGQVVTVRVTELNRNERKMRLTIRGLYELRLKVPLSHVHLIIGQSGSIIKSLSAETQTQIDLEEDGLCIIQGLTNTNINNAKLQIEQILRTRIVTFRINDHQAGLLIGRGGNTVKSIQKDTGARIQVDSTNQVIVTAENDQILNECIMRINDKITYYQSTIRIPSDRIGFLIGRGGENLRQLTAIGVRVDLPRENPGIVIVSGKSKREVEQAIQQIIHYAGWFEKISSNEGTMPIYFNAHHDVPLFSIKSRDSRELASIPSRLSPAHQSMQMTKTPTHTNKPTQTMKTQIYQSQIQIQLVHLNTLLRKQGGFLATIFGGGKSAIDKIMEETNTQIKINSTTGVLTVIGRSQDLVNRAIKLIQQLAR